MACNKKVLVELFFDVVSPYSWITFNALTKYQKIWGNMELKLSPVFLGGIMGATSNQPPGMIPAKGSYMLNDLLKISEYFDVPYKRPENIQEVMFRKGTIKAQRLLTAVSNQCPQHLESLGTELYLRVWFKDLDVTSETSLVEACKTAGVPDKDINHLVNSTQDDNVKSLLRSNTERAVELGAFGVPFYVVHLKTGPTVMFGSDRLFLLCHYLNQTWPGALSNAKL